MTIGQRLREAREASGMSIGDVARRTYIQPKFIQAIDEDNFSVLPASHWKFFVREYAKMVDLDIDDVLGQLPQGAPPSVAPSYASRPASALATAPTALFGDEETVLDAEPAAQRKREYQEILSRIPLGQDGREGLGTATWLIIIAAVLLVGIGVYYFFFRDQETGTITAVTTQRDTSEAAPDQVISRPDVDSTTSTPAETGDSLTLEGRANSAVWYNVVMDGKRTESDTLAAGATKVWRAAENFKISLGNAGGLDMFLNDKPLGTLGPKKSAVRNVVIDATGVVRKGTSRRAPARTTRRATPPVMRPITPTEVRPPGQ